MRIIPTGVGKSQSALHPGTFLPDHPHGCGEKLAGPYHDPCPAGSSPRVWGKAADNAFSAIFFRIIPTGVGKRATLPPGCPPTTDHPHGCGEKRTARYTPPWYPGSSPRVWGKEIINGKEYASVWIIPTGVGKRGRQARSPRGGSDHPHGCGEKNRKALNSEDPSGSSPRVWGKGVPSFPTSGPPRIIPTGVGKRGCAIDLWCSGSDHPHGCGEKKENQFFHEYVSGSSPRVWGKGQGFDASAFICSIYCGCPGLIVKERLKILPWIWLHRVRMLPEMRPGTHGFIVETNEDGFQTQSIHTVICHKFSESVFVPMI